MKFYLIHKNLCFLFSVESDKTQLASDWDLREMIMWKITGDDHKHSQVYFPVNEWIGKKRSTFKAKRDKYESTDHHPRGTIIFL
jgi:hypothetical protein